MKLDLTQQLPIALRWFVADDDMDARRTQHYRLCQSDIVPLQQPLRAKVFELRKPLFTFKVGEQPLIDGFRCQAEFRRHVLQNSGAVRRRQERFPVVAGLAARNTAARNCSGGWSDDDLELAAIRQELDQPLMDELAGVVAERLPLFVLQLAARFAFLTAEQLEQSLGRFDPCEIGSIDIMGNDPITGVADADHFAGEHGDSVVLG